MKQRVYSILVDNSAGVLSRVANLFSRRGYNIDSLTVGVTADPAFSRMTIVCSGDDSVLEQIHKQLAKMVDVRDVKVLEPEASVTHELMMVKLTATGEDRQSVMALAEIFKAKTVDVGPDSMILEVVGSVSKLAAFLNLLSGYEILELARTGVTGLSRGVKDVKIL
jgi:acetolactate synthase-1/3 small subunit